MPHKKGKSGYKKGGVVGTAGYRKQQYGKSQKADLSPKRKGYSDMSDGYEKHEYGYSPRGGNEERPNRKGWSDQEGSRISYSPRGGSAQNSDKFKKRRGYSDHGVEHAYQDGGIVGAARRNALMDLKSKMSAMGGDSLFDSIGNDENAYKDGGVVKASVMAKDEEGLKKGLKKAAEMMGKYNEGGLMNDQYDDQEYMEDHAHDKYEDLSREELLSLLKNR